MLADAVQGVAEDHGPAQMRVKEWLHSKMIPRAEQALARPVPHGKGKIAEQVLDTFLTPRPIGPQKQLDVDGPGLDLLATGGQLPDQVASRVHPSIGHDPDMAIERERLLPALEFLGGLEQCV